MAEEAEGIQNPFDLEAAKKLPKNIYFGSSTWTYPGWKNLIYKKKYRNEKEFKSLCLEEYAKFAWVRSVGIDSSFYTPPAPALLKHYAALVPDNFKWVSKVWERITIPQYPAHARYGKNAGLLNPDFLNAELFSSKVLEAYTSPEVLEHTGPFVFQFPSISKNTPQYVDFFKALASFLSKIPKTFRYAVELRNSELLTPQYFEVLNASGVTHCFNHWFIMPTLRDQMKKAHEAGGLKANFFVARILTPRGVTYEKAVKLFQPYDSIKQPIPEMRKDVCTLAKRAIERGAEAYIIVNNRSEGNSPMTIDALGRVIVSEL